MTVQAGLCQTWSEPKLLVFSRTCSYCIQGYVEDILYKESLEHLGACERPDGTVPIVSELFLLVLLYKVVHMNTIIPIFEPPHEKTNNLHRRKQRRRSASR